jgi:prevent-host-death family protein
MSRTITTSALREQIRTVLDEVGFGTTQYVIERNGQPVAALIPLDDLRLLESTKRLLAKRSLQDTLAGIRTRGAALTEAELDALIEEARTEYQQLHGGGLNGR